ncbi:MAG: penicillin-binding protein 2 [bacterium]
MDENIKKFRLLRNIIIGGAIIIILASIRLQIIEGKKYSRLSEKNRIRQRHITTPRGKIFDRNGFEIANTRPGFYVSVIQSIIDDTTLDHISEILEIDKETALDKFKLEKNPFMPVKIAHDISYEELSIIEENIDDMNGVEVGVEPLRNYPYGELLCHILGYVGEITSAEIEHSNKYSINDYIGRMGLEEYYEEQLRGKPGVEFIEVDALGREIGKITEKRPIPVTHGQDLYTTVDVVLAESVAVYLTEYQRAACVCLDPKSGGILVLYSKPGFDPNLFVHGLQKKEWQIINTTPDAPMYNRALMSCYPCGSTFKPFIALAALDANIITPEKTFMPCTGRYRLGRRTFKCWKKHGRLDLAGAVVNSCDVYFYQLGRLTGIDTIASKSQEFGFGKLTGIDLPGEKKGCLPDRILFEKKYGKNWTDGHIFNLSIGQGDLLATPLQMACAYTIFTNDGKTVVPHVITVEEYAYHPTTISGKTIKIVEEMLAGVVASGTGQLARLNDFVVCGKTGTVQNPHGEDHALFIGFAPQDEPKIMVCLIVENAGHGGSIAAPIVGKIISTYLNKQRIAQNAK